MKVKQIILLTFLLVFTLVKAQNEHSNTKPKVGLVLSGGGAKGIAHIGVLKVIDSLGIKIDYIAGTSMGAIIGSLYATGYSGKQLEKLVKAQDFDELLNDNFPRSTKSIYERENAEKYAVSLPFDKFKINLPSALSRGQNVYNLLYHLMLPVDDIRNFKNLPIPFFCVATDIETGESVILDKGRLAEAVAASAAIPTLLQPVKIGNRIFVDGGVTDNYPIEELRSKGMDIIIGVDVQDGLRDREQLTSAPEILLQISNFRTINAMKDKVSLTDVYIKPDIKDFTVVSFDKVETIIDNGAVAARTQVTELEKVKRQQSVEPNRPLLQPLDSIKIRGVGITGFDKYTRSYLLGKLKLKGGKKMAYSDFKKGINSLIATNNFETFKYHLEPNGNPSEYNLLGEIEESKASTFLKLGVHYDELYKSAALVNLTKKRLLFDSDIASLDVILGENSRYNFSYFIDKGYYLSIGVKSRFNKFGQNVNPLIALDDDSPLLNNLNQIDVDLSDFTNQVFLETIFRKDFTIGAGIEHKRLKITTETLVNQTNQDEIVIENTDYFSLFGQLKYDTYSHPFFPKSGFLFKGDYHLYFSASGLNNDFQEFSLAKGDLGYAFSIANNLAVRAETSLGLKIGGDSTPSLDYALGGYGDNLINNLYSFYGYDYLELTGNSFVKGGITIDYELFEKHHLILAANYANVGNDLVEDGTFISTPDFSGYALGYSLETFLGPLEAKFTYSPETGESIWFFNLGFWF